jgi:hypothetical protein
MLDNLIPAIVVAAISGLTFIAYKHPNGYGRIYMPLMYSAFGIFLVCGIFHTGYLLGFGDASVSYLKLNKIPLNIPETPSNPYWILIAFCIFVVYLSFLRVLPDILGFSSKNGKEDESENKANKKDNEPDT